MVAVGVLARPTHTGGAEREAVYRHGFGAAHPHRWGGEGSRVPARFVAPQPNARFLIFKTGIV